MSCSENIIQLILPLKLKIFFCHILFYSFHQQLFLSGNFHNYFKLNIELQYKWTGWLNVSKQRPFGFCFWNGMHCITRDTIIFGKFPVILLIPRLLTLALDHCFYDIIRGFTGYFNIYLSTESPNLLGSIQKMHTLYRTKLRLT